MKGKHMPKLATCPYCHKEIQKDEPVKKYKNRNYHLSCYQKYCEEVYKQSPDNGGNNDKQELYDYICKIFDIEELTPFLNFQLQKIFKENKFTYHGVLYSLKYFYEIKENPVNPEYGIGIVPLVYEDAKNFYIKKSILWEKNARFNTKKTTKTVRINTKQSKTKPLIDISKL